MSFNPSPDADWLTKMRGGKVVYARDYYGQMISIFMRSDRRLISIDNNIFDNVETFETNSGFREFDWREFETQHLDEAIHTAKKWVLSYYQDVMLPLMREPSGGHPADAIAQVKTTIQSIKQDLGL